MSLELEIIKWDMRFLKIAQEVASWSKDPSTGVGCFIVDSDRRFVSAGYNGLPRKMKDDGRLHIRDWKIRTTIHAEENAIILSNRVNLNGCVAYTYPFMPCAHCASVIIQKGIVRVVTFKNGLSSVGRWSADMNEARLSFDECGVELIEYANDELEKIT